MCSVIVLRVQVSLRVERLVGDSVVSMPHYTVAVSYPCSPLSFKNSAGKARNLVVYDEPLRGASRAMPVSCQCPVEHRISTILQGRSLLSYLKRPFASEPCQAPFAPLLACPCHNEVSARKKVRSKRPSSAAGEGADAAFWRVFLRHRLSLPCFSDLLRIAAKY